MHRIIGLIVLAVIILSTVPVYAASGCLLTKTTYEKEIDKPVWQWAEDICEDVDRYCEWINHPDPECEEVDCKVEICFISEGSIYRTSWSCGANPLYKSSSTTTTEIFPLPCGEPQTCYSSIISTDFSYAKICCAPVCLNCSADAFADEVESFNTNVIPGVGHVYDVSCTVFYCDCNTGGEPDCIREPCSYPW